MICWIWEVHSRAITEIISSKEHFMMIYRTASVSFKLSLTDIFLKLIGSLEHFAGEFRNGNRYGKGSEKIAIG